MGAKITFLGITLGPYQIVRKLGEGAMGSVWEAMNPAIGRRVAIKFLRSDYAQNDEYLSRFFNEARAANAVEHPGVVQIFETGMLDAETPYMLMELIKGVTVEKRIAQAPYGMDVQDAVSIARQVADVLAALHEQGIVHRDLKPSNLMLIDDPVAPRGIRVKVLDLGLAKLRPERHRGGALTLCGAVMGTPIYMAPEQCCDARETDGQADVYSLGIVLFEMIVGEPPYLTADSSSIMRMHLFAPVPTLRQVAPRIPAAVADLVTAMLQKEPGQRPTMAAVRDRLAALTETGHALGQTLRPQPTRPRPARRNRGSSLATAAALYDTEPEVTQPLLVSRALVSPAARSESAVRPGALTSPLHRTPEPTVPRVLLLRQTGSFGTPLAVTLDEPTALFTPMPPRALALSLRARAYLSVLDLLMILVCILSVFLSAG